MAAVTWAQLGFKCQEMACNVKQPEVVLPVKIRRSIAEEATSREYLNRIIYLGTNILNIFSQTHIVLSLLDTSFTQCLIRLQYLKYV